MKMSYIKMNNPQVILDSINDAVVAIGLDKKIKYMNRAAEQLLGYSFKEAREMPCSTIVNCAACENDCLLEQTISTDRPITHYETVLKNKVGRIITVSFNTALLRDENGQIIGEVEIIRDMSKIEALTQELKGKYSFDSIVGKNHRMQEIYTLLPDVAKTESNILIEGEPGTGKELVAHAIHQNSPHRDKPFIKVSCSALADRILASELFGHVKGAFTGAHSNKAGLFELAQGGTLFLDGIEEMSLPTQAKLLQVLQEGWLEQVGGSRKIKVDVRVIAAAHRDLKKSIEQGKFRKDLYDHLRMVFISLPPLRERRDDIPLLVHHFMTRSNREMGKMIESVAQEAMEVLLNYDYPGNILELENILKHAMTLCQGKSILPSHLPRDIFQVREDFVELALKQDDPFKVLERQLLLKILSQTGWNYRESAECLGISRTTLWRRIKGLGISRTKSKFSTPL